MLLLMKIIMVVRIGLAKVGMVGIGTICKMSVGNQFVSIGSVRTLRGCL